MQSLGKIHRLFPLLSCYCERANISCVAVTTLFSILPRVLPDHKSTLTKTSNCLKILNCKPSFSNRFTQGKFSTPRQLRTRASAVPCWCLKTGPRWESLTFPLPASRLLFPISHDAGPICVSVYVTQERAQVKGESGGVIVCRVSEQKLGVKQHTIRCHSSCAQNWSLF